VDYQIAFSSKTHILNGRVNGPLGYDIW